MSVIYKSSTFLCEVFFPTEGFLQVYGVSAGIGEEIIVPPITLQIPKTLHYQTHSLSVLAVNLI